MCGIAGAFGRNEAALILAVEKMNDLQVHRGPDDVGFERFTIGDDTLVLGHRRLSILDLSSSGHQPMQDPDSGNWVVYNGEIYNYPQLKRELEVLGARFLGHSDTEAILHGYRFWGVEVFRRLQGMFAIGLFDRAQRLLHLARDRQGIKPLYYTDDGAPFAFASEVRTLARCGLAERELDRRSLATFLAYGSVQGPLTLYRGISLLPAGHLLTLSLDSSPKPAVSASYVEAPPSFTVGDRHEAVARLTTCLEEAVGSHLQSDVPVGVFLSAGLDSTTIAVLASRLQGGGLDTFTIGLTDRPEMDESRIAERTARQLGTAHHTLLLSEAEVQEQAQRWLGCLDQPTIDGLNTYIISDAVRREGIKVVLSGLGGDEIFGGYSSFHEVPRIARILRNTQWLAPELRARLFALLFRSESQKQKARELMRGRPDLADLALRRRRLFADSELSKFGFDDAAMGLTAGFLEPDALAVIEEERTACQDAESVVSLMERRFYMENTLLRDSDVFGMAHSLEIRVPMLHPPLLEFVTALPGEWRKPMGTTNKPLLVDAMRELLPPEVLGRAKRGFNLSQAKWMRGPLRELFLHYLDNVKQQGILPRESVDRVWQAFLADAAGPTWSRAWALGVMGAWLDGRAV